MPTVSELFYNRRSRYNRAATDPGFDSLPPPPSVDRSHNHNQSRRHHNSDGCDPLLRRTPPHFRHRSSLPLQQRAPVGLDQGRTHPGSGNGVAGSSGGLSGNERLPGSVLLARERLLERLRGMPPSETRRHRALHIYGGGLLHDDDLSPPVRDSDAEILTGRPASAYSSTNLGSQIESLHLLQESNKKPPGLSQEVFDCLNPEIFSSTEMGVEGLELGASQDCSICLESFMDGDKLICLPCEHRFHAACLSPWAHIRGDCPYCRKVIVVDSQTAKRNT
ncbi:probable E3 ubiquitin-protein ligase RHY1A [Pyrus x bretschneideri]|uniref:probable E3 ubiquitin-protein ligase RHY1A n=1 Tax=Pyrus x bretschneideri TaxID=225117 RepID=UPI00202DE3E7|nr:probable E3 ubiquitin-protein ligase RHY1A [Pyrus x bretschneideri]